METVEFEFQELCVVSYIYFRIYVCILPNFRDLVKLTCTVQYIDWHGTKRGFSVRQLSFLLYINICVLL